ncbi:MAG: thioredoxin domain-containing protein [bacterium]|nr:thioredoxin domain-containing protein [bacterium]
MENNKFFLPTAVILAGLFIGGAVIWNGQHPATSGYGTDAKGGFGNEASIQKLTKTIRGIDANKVVAAVKANESTYKAAIEDNRTEATKFGINATPSFIIGTTLVAGAQPYANFEKALATPLDPTSKVNVKDVLTAGEPSLGDPDASITIAFWSDFQCPYCKSFETGGVPQIPTPAAMPDIVKNYVDTGKAKIVFKDFAFLGPDSDTAALYGRAVWELYPEQYMAWRTAMYKAQDGENDSE